VMARLALRDRLAVSFTVTLLLAYVALAACAIFVMNRALKGSIDGRLSTVAQAIVTIAGDERDEVDHKDRQQFASLTADASGALVLDPDGAIVLGTTEDIPAWVPSAIREAQAGRAFTARNAGHAIRAIVERRHKHGTSSVVVWQSMQIVYDVEAAVLFVLGGFGIAVALGGYAVGAQIARRGLLPLTRISAIVADIAAHDLTTRVGPQPHADEVGQLAVTFDRMLDRLQSAFERERRFTADASHDLRAPLATLRAEVDLALRRERTPAEYRAALEAIAQDADQLDRLIDALLAAARSEAAELTLQPLDLSVVARAAIDGIATFARAKHVTIDAQLPAGSSVDADADLLERAIVSTLHNAVKHTPAASVIQVDIASGADGVTLCVRDQGPGFSDAALTHAFDRFWRDDAARGRSSGSGLGLAIAGEILRRCRGTVAIRNIPSGGAEFRMRFPTSTRSPLSGEWNKTGAKLRP
jgi:signal transduction histidine kinase